MKGKWEDEWEDEDGGSGPPERKPDPNAKSDHGQIDYYTFLCKQLDIPPEAAEQQRKQKYDSYGKLKERIEELRFMRECKKRMSGGGTTELVNLFRALIKSIDETGRDVVEREEPLPGYPADGPPATRVPAERGLRSSPGRPLTMGLIIGGAIIIAVPLVWYLTRRK